MHYKQKLCLLCDNEYLEDLYPEYKDYCSKEHFQKGMEIKQQVSILVQSIRLSSKHDITD